MSTPIYLDYAATTPVDPVVTEVMLGHLGLDGCFANPASRSHFFGWQAEAAVEKARKQVAGLVNADVREIVWTSGATEANNLAIKGYMDQFQGQGAHVLTSATEHKAVLDCVSYLEERGFKVTRLTPDGGGRVTPELVAAAINDETRLISVMHVNNETGVVNDIEGIAVLARERGIAMHIDAAQSAGKIAIDVGQLQADFISFSAHKIYGPKGVGALYVRRRPDLVLTPQIHGGGHERGMRSGTLATHQLVAMGACFELAGQRMAQDAKKITSLRQCFLEELGECAGLLLNGDQAHVWPGILNIAIEGIDGQLMLSALPNLAISSGSACTSATMAPSHVLSAMGLSESSALSSLRISFGRFTTADEAHLAGKTMRAAIERIRA